MHDGYSLSEMARNIWLACRSIMNIPEALSFGTRINDKTAEKLPQTFLVRIQSNLSWNKIEKFLI